MITTMLQGGLGNQLFQYFMGKAQSQRFQTELQLDISLLRNDPMRQYNLGLFHSITDLIVTGRTATVNERGLPYDQELVDSIKDGDTLRGYWQCEDYFRGRVDVFNKLNIIVPEHTDVIARRIKRAGATSTFLTIRRSDYLQKQDFHGVLPLVYYWNALMAIANRIKNTPTVFVFSDDPEWCKTELKLPYDFEVVGTYDRTTKNHIGCEDLDLYLMSLCHNGVMANSSFSWWGAWLGDFQQRERVVIAPQQWFTTTAVDSSTIVPDRWIRL